MAKITLIRQPKYVGGRLPVGSAFAPPLESAVKQEMRRFNASRSFVIATCVAFALGVEEQPDYRKILPRRTNPKNVKSA
jgi:hypothetical protein